MKKQILGFTLIELLIVIAIIGVLSAFLTANYINVRQRARDTQRRADISQIQAALELYRADYGFYPDPKADPNWLINCPTSSPVNFGNEADTTSPCSITYMQTVPKDSLTNTSYYYTSNPSGAATTYCVRTCLENENDPQIDLKTFGSTNPSVGTCAFSGTGSSCPYGSSGNYSYTLQNP